MDLWINGDQHVFDVPPADGLSVAQVVSQLGWPAQRVAVELNGQVVPKNEHEHTDVKNDDKMEIVTLIGGG